MSEHAAVKEEHRKLASECWRLLRYTHGKIETKEQVAQLLADFERDERLKEAGLASQRAHCFMDVHSFPKCWYCQRIEQLKRGEL